MINHFPARVSRQTAMQILCIRSARVFRKVVDANPQMVHRLPGETRAHYLRDELLRLLSVRPRCATRGEGSIP